MPTVTDDQTDGQVGDTGLTPEEQEQARVDAEFSDIMGQEGMSPQNYYDNHFNQIATREHNPDTTANWDNEYNNYYGDLDAPSNGALQPDALRQAETNDSPSYKPPAAAFGTSEAGMGAAAATEANQFKFDPSGGDSRMQHFRKVVFSKDPRNKRRLAVGGVFGGVTGIFLSLFTLILPLKLEATLQNLREYYFANAESVIAQRAGYLVEQYLLTSLSQLNPTKGCGILETVNQDCFIGTANTPVGALFQEWRQTRFEDKLAAEPYNITLTRQANGKKLLTVGGVGSIDFDEYSNGGNSNQARLNRTNYRRVINRALENETYYKRVYYRFRMGRLLQTKYGINLCLVACDQRKAIDGKIKGAKQFAQLTVVNRVVTPRSQFLGLVMGCIIDTTGTGCNTDPEFGGTDAEGNPQPDSRKSALEGELSRYARDAGLNVAPEAIEKAARILDDINTAGGFTEFIVGGIGKKIGQETGEKLALGSIPVIGWINTAINLTVQIGSIGTFLRYANYADHALTAVQVYSTWAAYGDEVKRGFGDSTITASMAGALSDGIADKPSDQPAEVAPMWAEINGAPASATSAFNWLLPSAFAAGETAAVKPQRYTCDDTQPIPTGQKICPEEDFQLQEGALQDFTSVTETQPLKTIVDVAATIKTPINAVTGIIDSITGAVIENLPGYEQLLSLMGPIVNAMMGAITKYLIPTAVSLSMTGARLFQVMAAGANVTASTACQLTLGCPAISGQTAYKYRQQALAERKAEFASKSFKDRLFARDDTRSLINRVALAAPGSTSRLASSSVASMLSSPFKTMGSSISGLFRPSQVLAVDGADPWGIPQAGYALDDPVLTADPATYTKEYCAGLNEAWKNSFQPDPVSGQDVPTIANPCMLESAVAQSLGGFNNSDLLPADSLGGTVGGAVGTPAAAVPATGTSPDKVDQAKLGTHSDTTACAPGTTDMGVVESRYTGEYKKVAERLKIRLCRVVDIPGEGNDTTGAETPGGAVVEANVSGAWAALARQAKAEGIKLSANSSFRLADSCGGTGTGDKCAAPGKSAHQTGWAIDFASMSLYIKSASSCANRAKLPSSPQWSWMEKNAAKYGFGQYSREAWHWDAIPGRCGGAG